MKYQILQMVKIVDMNDEIMKEIYFEHGSYDFPALASQTSVVTHRLGLKGFDVVYDKREAKTERYKITEMEVNLTQLEQTILVYIEPITLILGQHDVGEV